MVTKDLAKRYLTSRETDVLELLSFPLNDAAIACHLNLTRRSINGHVKRIMHKLSAETRWELYQWGQANGYGIKPRDIIPNTKPRKDVKLNFIVSPV